MIIKKELEKRKNSYGSYVTNLTIKGFRRGQRTEESYPLFYVNIHPLMSLHSKVLRNSSVISSLISKLPKFIIESYFHKLIVNEAQSNNEIEGVQSTKKELKEALGEVMEAEKRKKRFKRLMKTYLYIEKIKSFTETLNFRELYDQLVSDEMDKDDEPDGKFFRKEDVHVTASSKITHIGVSTEAKIVESLNAFISFLDDERHPALYRYLVGHYYYEYIHPFYDGNRRTGYMHMRICIYYS